MAVVQCQTCQKQYDMTGYPLGTQFPCPCGATISYGGASTGMSIAPSSVASEGADFFSTGGGVPPTGPSLSSSPHSAPMARLSEGSIVRDRYRIERQLGEGGMGIVYLVHDQLLNQHKAMKWLHPQLDEAWRQKLLDELRMQQQLSHEGILRSYEMDIDPQSGQYFFTMEYVEGPSLETKLQDAKKSQVIPPFSLAEVAKFLDQLTDALSYAHSKGIVHRDLKPSNILLPEGGGLKLLDFGIARQVGEGVQHTGLVGTAIYMAPEQMRGGSDISPAADVYSTGVILYQMLTGELFYGRMPGPSEMLDNMGIDGAVPEAVDEVVLKSLEALPRRRYGTIDELCDEFLQACVGVLSQQPAPSASTGRSSGSRSRKNFWKQSPATSDDTASSSGTPTPPPASPPSSGWKREAPSPVASFYSANAEAASIAAVPTIHPPGFWKTLGLGSLSGIAGGLSVSAIFYAAIQPILPVVRYGYYSHQKTMSFMHWVIMAVIVGVCGGLLARWLKGQMLERWTPATTTVLLEAWAGGLIGAMTLPRYDDASMGMAWVAAVVAPFYARRAWKKGTSSVKTWIVFALFCWGFVLLVEPRVRYIALSSLVGCLITGWLLGLLMRSTLESLRSDPNAVRLNVVS